MVKNQVNVACINETWLKSTTSSSEFIFSNFNIVRIDRDFKKGGGSLILIDRRFKYDIVNTLMNQDLEMINVSLMINETLTLNIILIYRPPNASIKNFFQIITSFLDNTNIYKTYTIILGDFNINLNDSSSQSKNLIEIFKGYNLNLVNKEATRHGKLKDTKIDLIFSNNTLSKHILNCLTKDCSFSDHNYIILNFKKAKINQNSNTINIRNYSKFNKCREEDYQKFQLFDSNNFNDLISNSKNFISNFITSKECKIKYNNTNHWISREVLQSIKIKNYHYKKFKLNKNKTIGKIYKKYFLLSKSRCNVVIKKAKCDYFKNIFRVNSNNPKETWKIINNYLNNNKNVKNQDLKMSPNDLNSFFIRSGKFFDNCIPINYEDNENYKFERFSFESISLSNMLKFLPKIANKSEGFNGIPYRIIEKFKFKMLNSIAVCINNDFSNNNFNHNLKTSVVTPIYKSGDKTDAKNYRPISNINNISKLFENVMYAQMNNYLARYNLLFNYQFGFRENLSTKKCFLTILNEIHSNDENNFISICIFLDLSKAFDSINHQNLLNKCYNEFNFSLSSISVIKNYLSDRYQIVKINDEVSNPLILTQGVPQGSKLGPLLFIMYINDMQKLNLNSKIFMYADDITLVCKGKDIKSCINYCNKDLKEIENFCNINHLKINVSKTKGMLMFQDEDINDIYLKNDAIEFIKNFKLLGYNLNYNINFNIHFSSINKKLNSATSVIYRLNSFFPKNILKLIYNSIILSHVNYSDYFLNYLNKTNLHKINNFIITAQCIIFNCFKKYVGYYNEGKDIYFFRDQSIIKLCKDIRNKTTNNHNEIFLNMLIPSNCRTRSNFFIPRTNRTRNKNALFLVLPKNLNP